MHVEQIEQITSRMHNNIKLEDLVLPSPPGLLQEICALQNDPHQNAEDVVEILKDYPLTSERLLQLANSAKFRPLLEITTVRAAIMRLGISRVLSLLSGMSISQYLSATHTPGLEKYFKKMWSQSLDVASIAYIIAECKTNVDPEKALLAGMVHNIGVLSILLSLDNTPILQQNPTVMRDVADTIIPKYYPYAGRVLMQSWELPQDIVAIATSHVNNLRPVHDGIDLCDVIQIAYAINKAAGVAPEYEFIEFVYSTPFKKFWNSWQVAVEELHVLATDIQKVRNIIAI